MPEWEQRHNDPEAARFYQLQLDREQATDTRMNINDVMDELDRRDKTKAMTMNVCHCPIVVQDPAKVCSDPVQRRPPRSLSTALAPFVSPALKVKLMAVKPILEGSLGDNQHKHSSFEGSEEHARRVPPWAPSSGFGGPAAAPAMDLGRSSPAVRIPPRRSASRGRSSRDSPTPAWEWGSLGGRSKSPQDLSRSRGPPAREGAVLHPVGSAAQSSAFGARAASRR